SNLQQRSLGSGNRRPRRSACRKRRGRPHPRARLAGVVLAVVGVEGVAVGAPPTTRPRPQKRGRQKRTTKPLRSATPPKAPLRASADGGGGVDGGERRGLPLQTTRRTPLFEYANPAVKKPTTKF